MEDGIGKRKTGQQASLLSKLGSGLLKVLTFIAAMFQKLFVKIDAHKAVTLIAVVTISTFLFIASAAGEILRAPKSIANVVENTQEIQSGAMILIEAHRDTQVMLAFADSKPFEVRDNQGNIVPFKLMEERLPLDYEGDSYFTGWFATPVLGPGSATFTISGSSPSFQLNATSPVVLTVQAHDSGITYANISAWFAGLYAAAITGLILTAVKMVVKK